MHDNDTFSFLCILIIIIHVCISQVLRSTCPTWWSLRGSSGLTWARGKTRLQTSLFISHRYKSQLTTNSCCLCTVNQICVFWSMQELPKYLKGYHSVSREDAITLGGLLFRAKGDSSRSQFVMIPKMLKDLVPADLLKIMSSEEWKKVKEDKHRQAETV